MLWSEHRAFLCSTDGGRLGCQSLRKNGENQPTHPRRDNSRISFSLSPPSVSRVSYCALPACLASSRSQASTGVSLRDVDLEEKAPAAARAGANDNAFSFEKITHLPSMPMTQRDREESGIRGGEYPTRPLHVFQGLIKSADSDKSMHPNPAKNRGMSLPEPILPHGRAAASQQRPTAPDSDGFPAQGATPLSLSLSPSLVSLLLPPSRCVATVVFLSKTKATAQMLASPTPSTNRVTIIPHLSLLSVCVSCRILSVCVSVLTPDKPA